MHLIHVIKTVLDEQKPQQNFVLLLTLTISRYRRQRYRQIGVFSLKFCIFGQKFSDKKILLQFSDNQIFRVGNCPPFPVPKRPNTIRGSRTLLLVWTVALSCGRMRSTSSRQSVESTLDSSICLEVGSALAASPAPGSSGCCESKPSL